MCAGDRAPFPAPSRDEAERLQLHPTRPSEPGPWAGPSSIFPSPSPSTPETAQPTADRQVCVPGLAPALLQPAPVRALVLGRDAEAQEAVLAERLRDRRRLAVAADNGADTPVARTRMGRPSAGPVERGSDQGAQDAHEEAERAGRRQHVLGQRVQRALGSGAAAGQRRVQDESPASAVGTLDLRKAGRQANAREDGKGAEDEAHREADDRLRGKTGERARAGRSATVKTRVRYDSQRGRYRTHAHGRAHLDCEQGSGTASFGGSARPALAGKGGGRRAGARLASPAQAGPRLTLVERRGLGAGGHLHGGSGRHGEGG